MVSSNYECYKFTNSQEKITYLMYMDDRKLHAKNKGDFDTNNKNILQGYCNGNLSLEKAPCWTCWTERKRKE